jgi:hypothetical protein
VPSFDVSSRFTLCVEAGEDLGIKGSFSEGLVDAMSIPESRDYESARPGGAKQVVRMTA